MTTRRTFLSLLSLGALARIARGQQAPFVPSTLADHLRELYWPPESRGALIAVFTPSELAGWMQQTTLSPIPRGPDGYRLGDLAAAFERRVITVGAFTVLAPATMTLLRLPPEVKRPEDLPPESQSNPTNAFYASLTPAQWAQLGTSRGLSGADLRGAQRTLFLSLFPESITFLQYFGRPDPSKPAPTPRVLTVAGDDRLQLRVRITRSVRLSYMPEGTNGNFSSSIDSSGPLRRDYIEIRHSDYQSPTEPRVPNRPKPSELDTRALNASVPLTGGARFDEIDGVLRVAELIRRCGKACGLELYADARVGELPALVRGESARAGDVLDALAASVTGAFRRVTDGRATVYVLTDDIEGIAARMLRIARARQAANHLAFLRRIERAKKPDDPDRDPLRAMPFADAASYPAELLRRIDQRTAHPSKPGEAPGFLVRDLPPAIQAQIRADLAKFPTYPGSIDGDPDRPFRTDRVLLNAHTTPMVLLPDGSTTDRGFPLPMRIVDSGPDAPTPPPFSWPDAWKARVALIDGADSNALPALLTAAKKSGATLVMIDVCAHESSAAILKAAVAAGKRLELPIGAAIRLLGVPVGSIPDGAIVDLNARGENSAQIAARLKIEGSLPSIPLDSGRPDQYRLVPDNRQIDVFVKLSAISGLSEVALQDALPSGYLGYREIREESEIALGFTVANRLAYLREKHIDPIDLWSPISSDGRCRLPFFPDIWSLPAHLRPPDPQLAWIAQRAEEMKALRVALFDRLKRERPGLPIWLTGHTSQSFWGRWEKADAIPEPWRPGGALSTVAAHRFSPHAWRAIRAKTPSEMLYLLATFRAQEARPGALTWDGIVIDLTGLDTAGALSMLAAIPR